MARLWRPLGRLAAAIPPLLVTPMVLGSVAGVAFFGIFANVTVAALEAADYREAATITFLVTASGVTMFGLGAAVWSLVLGGAVQLVRERFCRSG